MGRIKTKLVKRLTFEVVKHHRQNLSKDFEENKKKVGAILEGSSKKIRNVIAGYVTRLMKVEE